MWVLCGWLHGYNWVSYNNLILFNKPGISSMTAIETTTNMEGKNARSVDSNIWNIGKKSRNCSGLLLHVLFPTIIPLKCIKARQKERLRWQYWVTGIQIRPDLLIIIIK